MNNFKMLSSLCAFSLIFSSSLYANHHVNEKTSHTTHHAAFSFVKKDAITIERTSSFELPMTPAQALPLFTAPGEILWAPGWNPNVLSGDGFEHGTVWLTQHGDVTTHWYVSKYDKHSKEAVYIRVTPGSDMGTVAVALSSNKKGGAKVEVTYKLTALSTEGNKKLTHHFNEKSYNAMIKEWKALIIKNMDKIKAHH
jgi:hypothetical protein